MSGHKKYEKVFIEEVSAFEGQDWWADAARPFPHKHVVRPTVTKQKCYNVIDVARVLGPAMILRDPLPRPCRKVHCPKARLSELNDSRA